MEFPLDVRTMHSENVALEGESTHPNTLAIARTRATAKIREQNQYFQVDEILGFELTGEGEHLYVQIRKNGQNTGWVKEQFAAQLGLNIRDIGHSGLKDRYALTSQWFSIYAPKTEPEIQNVQIEGVEVLQVKRHRQKLKPGMHEHNHFKIRLTEFTGDQEKTEQLLMLVKTIGFPNYFGNQRFGRDGGNLPKAWQLLKQRRLNKHKKKSIYLSSLRSFLFNRVLDAQLAKGSRQAEGTEAGPMWGRGRLNIPKEQAEFEQAVLEPWSELCDALEYSGLQQERRNLFVLPGDMNWSWLEGSCPDSQKTDCEEKQLELSFNLPSGSYATSLLREIARITDAALFRSKVESKAGDGD